MKIYIANNADALRAINPEFSVEAEFGDECVEGSVLTLAHHEPRSDNLAPCLHPEQSYGAGVEEATCVISHVDLDTLLGIAALRGNKPGWDRFWKVVAFIDVNGPHRMDEVLDGYEDIQHALNAYWAWNEDHKVFAPRDGTVLDVTDKVTEAIRVLRVILDYYCASSRPGDEDELQALIQAGREWWTRHQELERDSFVRWAGDVVVRKSDNFVNHLYAHDGRQFKAVVALNMKFNSVTVSLADPIDGVSCCDVVQSLWGSEAGGHAGIAGSPRGKEFGEDELIDAVNAMVRALQ